MGRQKTLWIDEACWEKLEAMGDDAVSAKIRLAIMQYDVDVDTLLKQSSNLVRAYRLQIDALKEHLKSACVQLAKNDIQVKDEWKGWFQ